MNKKHEQIHVKHLQAIHIHTESTKNLTCNSKLKKGKMHLLKKNQMRNLLSLFFYEIQQAISIRLILGICI